MLIISILKAYKMIKKISIFLSSNNAVHNTFSKKIVLKNYLINFKYSFFNTITE